MPGAKKPDGKGARTERVTFTRPAADRIARVVRQVEAGDRDGKGLVFGSRVPSGGGLELKLCQTTQEWEYNTLATLPVWHDGTPPDEEQNSPTQEVEDVVNKISYVPGETFVVIGRVGNGSWYLVAIGQSCPSDSEEEEGGHHAKWATEVAIAATSSMSDIGEGDGAQVLMHDEGCLTWQSLKKVTVLTDVSLTGNNLVFERKDVWIVPDVVEDLDDITIDGIECEEVEE